MIKLLTKTLPLSVLLLTACAQQSGWTPTVDSYNDPNAHLLKQDMKECEQLAKHSSGDTIKKAAIGTGVGAVAGGAGGAAIGAGSGLYSGRNIGSRAGTGAIIGASVGAITGGVQQGYQSNSQYKKIYSDCLRNRGHRILD
ncbi:MAG: hypothetical protein Q9M50_08090 [Methylococcales bacterium]|nr:hypothetical protein [Methylococcales bacterium]